MEEYINSLEEIIKCYKNIEINNKMDCTDEINTVSKVIEDIKNIQNRTK